MDVGRIAHVCLAIIFSCLPAVLPAASESADSHAAIKQALARSYPDIKILDVSRSTLPGLYEVFTGDSIAYTDGSGEHLLVGRLLDVRTKKDLTAERLDERNAIDFRSLPFDKAIKIVKGNGRRELAVFSDPDCPYCQKLERELASMTDVTVHIFLFPLTGVHPQAMAHARSIWCAPDRAQAWTQWMLKRTEPPARACEGEPTAELQALGQKLRIPGTPTMYLTNGRRIAKDLPKEELQRLLASSSAR